MITWTFQQDLSATATKKLSYIFYFYFTTKNTLIKCYVLFEDMSLLDLHCHTSNDLSFFVHITKSHVH